VKFIDFIVRNRAELLELTLEHLTLVAIAILIAVAIGVPLGIIITRRAGLRRWVLGAANMVQTVPSLALFGFLLPVPLLGGLGSRPAIVALVLYALLPIIRNTYTGIMSVDPAVREAARGMGMTDRQLLLQVELPLSLSVILAGIRVATVISVGIATIAAAIAAGGLGTYIFRGLTMANNYVILAGAVPAALLALLADFSLGWAERRLKVGR
jgi:osmoprotectant transport system permease protein